LSSRVFVGTSGWNYRHWSNGVFYPPGLKQSKWLEYYAQFFDSVEINNTFYNLPAKHVFTEWHNSTPANFSFAVKANRFITHMKKLATPEKYVATFLENVGELKEKLKVILFQLPPYWKFNVSRLEELLHYLKHQQIIPDPQCALEIRNTTWNCNTCHEILKRYNIALVFADWPGCFIESPVTANIVFIRRHGPGNLYGSNYSNTYLQNQCSQINTYSRTYKNIYVYFNNDAMGYAVQNAKMLKELLSKECSTK